MTSLDREPRVPPHEDDHYLSSASQGKSSRRSSGRIAMAIPDLRFEQSYLQSLQRFIHRDYTGAHLGIVAGGGAEKPGVGANTSVYGVPISLDWGWILYVTVRNQILAPFAQGAILAILTHYLRPMLRSLGARVRIHFGKTWQSIFPPLESHVKGGSGWVRNQLREYSIGGPDVRAAPAK